ncbi:MAG: tRNA (adenosine(37)-N6)-threonylcarbamoyltransferase complex ATPase subunit type 1 TsaE [Actinomycetia bacterium]|nr:tRNA (adenosine(37)-N6)-threonylcarbamoyltransferase complex ATPase subunit type 1 TsaE [Actinomycetes bacterium]
MSLIVLASASAAETQALGTQLAAKLCPNDVLLLVGGLGAGKTQFAQGVAAGLGISEPVCSPTFNLLLSHDAKLADGTATRLYHFDLYRLDTAEQLDDIDYFALLEDGAISLVEWGDRFPEALPEDYLLIEVNVLGEARDPTYKARHCAPEPQSAAPPTRYCEPGLQSLTALTGAVSVNAAIPPDTTPSIAVLPDGLWSRELLVSAVGARSERLLADWQALQ